MATIENRIEAFELLASMHPVLRDLLDRFFPRLLEVGRQADQETENILLILRTMQMFLNLANQLMDFANREGIDCYGNSDKRIQFLIGSISSLRQEDFITSDGKLDDSKLLEYWISFAVFHASKVAESLLRKADGLLRILLNPGTQDLPEYAQKSSQPSRRISSQFYIFLLEHWKDIHSYN